MIKPGPFMHRHSLWVVVVPSVSIMAVAAAGVHGCSLSADTVPEGSGGSVGQGGSSAQTGSVSQASSSGTMSASSSSSGNSASSGGNACNNGKKDGNETDIDCGGSCAKCPDGKACNGNDNNCTNGHCINDICCNTNCGMCETCSTGQCMTVAAGVDDPACGNTTVCGPNQTCVGTAGENCNLDSDCLSGSCCMPPCSPKNKCRQGGQGAPCATNADCMSNTCTSNTCT